MKGKLKKPIALLMAMALVFNMGFTAYAGAIPSNYNGNRFVATAEDTGGGGEDQTVTGDVYGEPVLQSVAPLATVYTLPVYTSDADLLDASGQSPNKKTTVEKIWLHNGVLYIGVIGSLKGIETVYYDGVSVLFSADISTDGTEPLRIDSETFPIPEGRDKEAHWVVIKVDLSDIIFDGPFSLGIDTSAGGFDPDNVEVTLCGYVIRYVADTGGHIDGLATQTVYIGGSTEPVTAVPDTGYSFVEWNDDITDPTRHETNVRADATYTAYFESTSTTYKVEHYKENLAAGTYTIADTESKTGTIGELTQAVAKSYSGFTAQPFDQLAIAADGSTVVKIYYDRNSYKLTYEITGSYFTDSEYAWQNYRYGEAVTAVPTPSEQGYDFNGWTGVPATMPANDVTATGYYTAGNNTYKVEHYQEGLTAGTYAKVDADTETKDGTTGELTEAVAKSYSGFNAQPFDQLAIAADGSTVVKIYYDRNSYKLTYEITGSYFTDPEYATQFYRYGEAVTAVPTPSEQGYDFNGWTGVPATMPANDVTATGYYTAGNNTYKVEHYQEGLTAGTYAKVDADTETKDGTTGELTEAVAKSYSGFNAQPFNQLTIAADGSTVVKIYYDRNSYKLTYEITGSYFTEPEYAWQNYRYGEAVTAVSTPSEQGYDFKGWTGVPVTMPANDVTATGYYTAGNNTYKVEHYQEGLTAGTYAKVDADTETKDGTTGELTEAVAKSYSGFNAQPFNQLTIAADGSTVVKIYYDRNSYKLTIHYVYAGGGTADNDYNDTLAYEEEYSHTSPLIEGYTADKLLVSGNMPASDVEVTVNYGINNYGLTIHYVYMGGGTAAPDYNDILDYKEAYSVYSPYIIGFTPDQWQVSGTMIADQVVITVTYTENDYYVYYTGGDSDDKRILMDKKNPYHYQNEVIVLANIDGVFVTIDDTPLDAPKFVKAGYHVIGWIQTYQYSPEAVSKAVVSGTEVQYYPGDKIVMPPYNINLDAVWAPNTDTQYKIETYLQEDGVYPSTATSSEVKNDGTTDAAKIITPVEIPGYTFDTKAGNVVEALIAADGSTVFKLYYKKIYTITYQTGENGFLTGGNQIHKLYYGDAYPTAPEPVANTNYIFAGWTPVLPGVEDTVKEDKTFTAYFTPKATTSYTVYYYKNGTTNSVHDPKTVTGQLVGSTVTENAVSVSGYSQVEPTSKTITLGESINTIVFYYVTKSTPDPKPRPKPNPVVVVEEPIPLALNMVDHFQYLQGYPDNTVRPEGNITREEVAAVFYRLLMDDYRGSIMTYDENFPDVEANTWSTKYIATLTNGKILEGYEDGTFRPHNFITKAELAAVASRFDNLSPFEDDSFTDIAGHWANKYINSAAKKGWVKGNPDGTFKPDKYITRAEFATLVNNVLDRKVHKDKILETARKFPDLPSTKWYYEAMMEAINSHLFNRLEDGYEEWTEISHPDIEL